MFPIPEWAQGAGLLICAAMLGALMGGLVVRRDRRSARRAARVTAQLRRRQAIDAALLADLSRTNRALRVRSRCGNVLLRADSLTELAHAVCATLVQEGGYAAACITPYADPSPVQGCAASHALALSVRGEGLGILHLGAAESLAFADDQELDLLRQLADDIAAAMARLRTPAQPLRDAVTGLAGADMMEERLHQSIAQAARSGHRVAVLTIALDRVRHVRDSLGQAAANAMLRHAAVRLGATVRAADMLAHCGGEQFVIVAGSLPRQEDALALVARVLAAIQAPVAAAAVEVATTASVGVGIYPQDGADAEHVLLAAHVALASAQAMGGSRYRFHAQDMNEQTRQALKLEVELRRAVEMDELRILYAQRLRADDDAVVAAEASLYWQHPQRGLMPAADVVALADNVGMAGPLAEWLLRALCRQQRAWLDEGLDIVPITVNLTPRQFHEPSLCSQVREALEEFRLPPDCVALEIAESSVLERADDAGRTLVQLKELGVRLVLGEVGAGQTSLSRLQQLPVDCLNIAQSFVHGAPDNAADGAICRAIVDLGHHLRKRVIASGVRTAAQASFLRSCGCDDLQGEYLARPLEAEACRAMLDSVTAT